MGAHTHAIFSPISFLMRLINVAACSYSSDYNSDVAACRGGAAAALCAND